MDDTRSTIQAIHQDRNNFQSVNINDPYGSSTEKTMMIILSTCEMWEDAISNWINIKALNKHPAQRPSAPSLDRKKQEELLGSVFFANMLNLQQSLDSDCGRKINGYFVSHLLLIHEMYCTECFATKSSIACGLEQADFSETDTSLIDGDDGKTENLVGQGGETIKEWSDKSTQTIKRKSARKMLKGLRTELGSGSKSKSGLAGKNSKSKTEENNTEKPKLVVKISTHSKTYTASTDIEKLDDESKNLDTEEDNDDNYVSSDDDGMVSNLSSETEEQESSKQASSNRYDFKCKQCDRSFDRPVKLRVHVDIHHGGKKFTCKICSKQYMKASSLKNHELVHTEGPVDCPDCGKKFQSSLSLKSHLKTHGEKQSHLCDLCGKEFFSKVYLKNHVRRVHTAERNFICDVCGKAFKVPEDLKTHSYIHTGGRVFTCDVCGLTFRHLNLVYKHKKKKHGTRDQLCNICGKAFFTVELLKRHERIHSEEPFYKCPTCGKGYRSDSGFRAHLDSHKGIVPNVCHICGKAFNCQSNMSKHIARHKKIKHHFCDSCDKGFLTKQELRAHSKVHETLKIDTHGMNSREKPNLSSRDKNLKPISVGAGSCIYATGPLPSICEPPRETHVPYPPYEFEDYRYF